jgi:hypothetical protein
MCDEARRQQYIDLTTKLTAAGWSREQLTALAAVLRGREVTFILAAVKMIVAARVGGAQADDAVRCDFTTLTSLRQDLTTLRQDKAHAEAARSNPAATGTAPRATIMEQMDADETRWAARRAGVSAPTAPAPIATITDEDADEDAQDEDVLLEVAPAIRIARHLVSVKSFSDGEQAYTCTVAFGIAQDCSCANYRMRMASPDARKGDRALRCAHMPLAELADRWMGAAQEQAARTSAHEFAAKWRRTVAHYTTTETDAAARELVARELRAQGVPAAEVEAQAAALLQEGAVKKSLLQQAERKGRQRGLIVAMQRLINAPLRRAA